MAECRSIDLTFVVRITCVVPLDVAVALVSSVRDRARARARCAGIGRWRNRR
jgi:hypothetical protein